jgi:4-hydroxybenzoate polyprenyltransferase
MVLLEFYFFGVLVAGASVLWRWDSRTIRAIVRDVRLTRLLHYELIFLLGVVIAFTRARDLPAPEESAKIFFSAIAIAFAWIYSVMTNNVTDLAIDKVSNPDRPLVTHEVDREHYGFMTWVVLGAAATSALASAYHAFSTIMFFIGAYFIYSMPPLRLKRIPFFSKMIIAGNTLALFALGLSMGRHGPPNLPLRVIVLFLLGFTAGINFIDLKDYEGDKRAGIKTIPVLLGMRRAQRFLGVSFLSAYGGAAVVFRANVLAFTTMGAFGFLQFYFLNRKNYDERPVMAVHVLTLVLVIAYVMVTKKNGIWS